MTKTITEEYHLSEDEVKDAILTYLEKHAGLHSVSVSTVTFTEGELGPGEILHAVDVQTCRDAS
jgi:hypothetical protein